MSAALAACGRVGYASVGDAGIDARDASLDAPGHDASPSDAPGLDAPGLDAPGLDAPGLDAPGLDAPMTDAPAVDAVIIDTAELPMCGDGIVEAFEQCDDANSIASDGCESNCSTTAGWVCAGEPSLCTTSCGDGVLAPSEICDDGNLEAGDGCSATCVIEAGFACNRGQAPYFAFRSGNRDCVEIDPPRLEDGTLFYTDGATVRIRHVGGAYQYATGGPWVAIAHATAWTNDGSGAPLAGPTVYLPPGTRTSADEASRAAAIAYAARAGALDLVGPAHRTIALSVWDGACADNSDELTVWRVDRLSQCVVAEPGLVSWLPLDDSLVDAIPGRPPLPTPASHGFVQGVHGWSLRLTSSPATMDTASLTAPSYTLAFWFAWADRSSPPPRMQSIVAVPGASVEARLDTTNTFSLLTRWDTLVTTSSLDVTVPHHIALVVSAGAGRSCELYVDGVSMGTLASDTTPSPLGAMLRMYAGEELDDLRVYDRALGPTEIAALATR
ncbi:MAG: DUF4215 domain-containing protein [Sandaracinus sp.]